MDPLFKLCNGWNLKLFLFSTRYRNDPGGLFWQTDNLLVWLVGWSTDHSTSYLIDIVIPFKSEWHWARNGRHGALVVTGDVEVYFQRFLLQSGSYQPSYFNDHLDEILITGSPGSCYLDNLQCREWCQPNWYFVLSVDDFIDLLIKC